MRKLGLILLGALIGACTVVTVKPVDRTTHDINLACIQVNDAVKPTGFLPLLEKLFNDHGIATERYQGRPPRECEYTVSYVAHWSWDIAVYLTDAEVVVRRDGEEVGRAVYHLRNKGGFDFGKWSSAESKMIPVMDKMLKGFEGKKLLSKSTLVPAAVPESEFEKAKKCQARNGVWVNDQCVIQVD
ncbi:MAG TPA: Sbal_3080 family lipoprotein [Steroidobacteraceae bacterium]|nr:Sbal_3080 family lipoprotein [Steroidobacteraceae bacterium]